MLWLPEFHPLPPLWVVLGGWRAGTGCGEELDILGHRRRQPPLICRAVSPVPLLASVATACDKRYPCPQMAPLHLGSLCQNHGIRGLCIESARISRPSAALQDLLRGNPGTCAISSQATPTVQCCTSRKGSPLPLSVILRVPHTSALTGKLPPDRKISMFLVRLASSLPSLSFLPSKDQTERQAFDWTALTASFWIPNNPLKTLFFNVGDAESSPPASAVTRIKGRGKKWMYKLSSQTKAQLAHRCSFRKARDADTWMPLPEREGVALSAWKSKATRKRKAGAGQPPPDSQGHQPFRVLGPG